jgi:hypothetical protein
MSADRGVTPGTAAGPRRSLLVEFGCDPARTFPRGEVCKNATNHHGLGVDDLATAALAVHAAVRA